MVFVVVVVLGGGDETFLSDDEVQPRMGTAGLNPNLPPRVAAKALRLSFG